MEIQSTKIKGQWLSLLIASCLLLLYWYSRIHDLLSFPIFLDETVHIQWAKDIYDLHPFTGASNGKLFGLWWIALFGLEGDGIIFVIRAATILFQTITIAGLFSLGRYFGGRWGAFLASSFYILSPYALFYDRFALVDSYVAVFGIMTAWFSIRYTALGKRHDATLAGFMLVGAILAKASGVMLWVVPFLAYWLLGRLKWPQRIMGIVWTYVSLLLIWLSFDAVLQGRGYRYFSTATTLVGSGVDDSILMRVWHNIISADGILTIDALYFSIPFMMLVLLCAIFYLFQNWRNSLFLLASMALPLGGLLAFATKLSPRYFQFHVPFTFLLAASAIFVLARYLHQRFKLALAVLPLLVLSIWGAIFALPFHQQYFHDPTQLAIPRLDRLEYIQSDAAGFAVIDVANYLKETSEAARQSYYVLGLLPNCDALAIYNRSQDLITVDCPLLKLDRSTQPEIDAHIAELAKSLAIDSRLWIVYEPTPFTTLAGIEAELTFVAQFVRPDELTHLELLEIETGINRD